MSATEEDLREQEQEELDEEQRLYDQGVPTLDPPASDDAPAWDPATWMAEVGSEADADERFGELEPDEQARVRAAGFVPAVTATATGARIVTLDDPDAGTISRIAEAKTRRGFTVKVDAETRQAFNVEMELANTPHPDDRFQHLQVAQSILDGAEQAAAAQLPRPQGMTTRVDHRNLPDGGVAIDSYDGLGLYKTERFAAGEAPAELTTATPADQILPGADATDEQIAKLDPLQKIAWIRANEEAADLKLRESSFRRDEQWRKGQVM